MTPTNVKKHLAFTPFLSERPTSWIFGIIATLSWLTSKFLNMGEHFTASLIALVVCVISIIGFLISLTMAKVTMDKWRKEHPWNELSLADKATIEYIRQNYSSECASFNCSLVTIILAVFSTILILVHSVQLVCSIPFGDKQDLSFAETSLTEYGTQVKVYPTNISNKYHIDSDTDPTTDFIITSEELDWVGSHGQYVDAEVSIYQIDIRKYTGLAWDKLSISETFLSIPKLNYSLPTNRDRVPNMTKDEWIESVHNKIWEARYLGMTGHLFHVRILSLIANVLFLILMVVIIIRHVRILQGKTIEVVHNIDKYVDRQNALNGAKYN